MTKKKNTVKFWIGQIHLWLGLTSGLIVFILAVTGCIYAFQKEIQDATQSYRFVTPRQDQLLPPSQLEAIAKAQLPGKHLHAVLYSGTDRAAQVIFYQFPPDYHFYTVFINPYTGEVQNVQNTGSGFFQFILDGHFYLWLPWEIGQPVVATATLVFVVMLISGIVLWWPKNKSAAKQRFTIKWSARWRRKNYDLHNVMGFYVSWVALILGLTGLVWGFQWFAKSVHWAAGGGENSLTYYEPLSDTTNMHLLQASTVPVSDKIWYKMRQEHPDAKVIEVHATESKQSPIAASANPDDGTYWKNDNRYFDQYTLKELDVTHIYGRYAKTSAADKLIRMNYDIHTGAIIGLAGKILAFFASLIVASLPVTGFLLWKGRRDKRAAPTSPRSSSNTSPSSPLSRRKDSVKVPS